MTYEVHLDVYDGPFDLLLQLITAQEVDVYEVQLSKVVDAFCAEIARTSQLDLEAATEFLLIAATLIELKCRRLLPDEPDPDLDEELSLFEARDYLLARLVECRMFTSAASALHALELEASRSFPRRSGPDERFDDLSPDLLANVSPQQLARIAAGVLEPRPVPVVATSHVHVDEVSVAELIDELMARLPSMDRTTLRELTTGASVARVVACFLALLELYKQSRVELVQENHLGALGVTWIGGSELSQFDPDGYDEGVRVYS